MLTLTLESRTFQKTTLPLAMALAPSITREHLDSYHIIKAVLREVVDIRRVGFKNGVSYFVIHLDGTSRKTVCRIYFGKYKYLAVIKPNRKLEKYRFNNVDELYKFAYLIRPVALQFD